MRNTTGKRMRQISAAGLGPRAYRTLLPAGLAGCLLLGILFRVDPVRGEDYFWNAPRPYNEGPWVGCDYLPGFPDQPCAHDAEGNPIYQRANYWGRSCCGCTLVPYPNGPSDRAFLGSNYIVNLYQGCGYPDCNVTLTALNMGWKGELSVYADLAVSEPFTNPASCLLNLNGGCHLTANLLNQGELDGYTDLDHPVTLAGSINNAGRFFMTGAWVNGGGPGTLTNSGAGFLDSEAFDTDLAITNAGQLWNMAAHITLRSSFTQTAGTLVINGPSYDTFVNNYQPLDLQGGMICGEGPILGQVDNSGGILAPGFPDGWWFGSSTRQMTVGGLTQGPNATLQIRLEQGDWDILYPTQWADQLRATGPVVLAGTLKIIHAARQLPGERYIVVSAANITGTFDHVTGPGQYALTYEPTRIILTVLAPGTDEMAPNVVIAGPTIYSEFSTSLPTVDLAGTSEDDIGLASVQWSNGVQNGMAAGTTDWSATGIPLQPGRNMITITAQDAAGNTGTARLAVTRLCHPWDLDGNGFIDRNDVQRFRTCAFGPTVPLPADCQQSDFDNDGDVDQADFGILQRCFRGPALPIDPDCAR